ncbi:acyl-homoserine-lactone acylase [Spirosoma lacussanchae]|uniref:penicillin acylase family protein n=1 Tax=Spirosoma lacussanchae TaxID=1884249 RepID=UPI0011084600|nr:penicillin acylase family protein [Spirosoma lacussanchae]
MKTPALFLICFSTSIALFAQIDPARVTIARDAYGVPHIFAQTDPEVAYGLAWAHAEDDFKTIQLLVLPAKGMLGRHLGKQGATADYVVELLHAPELVKERGETALDPDFRAVLTGYLQGLNDYARAHPAEVLVRGSFPVTLSDYLKVSVLSLSVISGVDRALQRIYGNQVPLVDFMKNTGSNAIAVHRNKTTEGQTMLAINSHQPLEGPVAWYEAHLCSEQGWNILGGLFPGGATIFHGVNEHLGWAHTVNYQDKIDIYQLQTDKAHPNQYLFDGQWLPLEEKRVRLRVKGIPVAINRKAYWSRYGATIKTKRGWFAIRTGANQELRGLQQWYRMNKARSFSEFRQALTMTAIPGFNIVYADADTIYYVSNGKIPYRNPDYDWSGTLPGNTSRTLWTRFRPLADFPQYLNPPGGYLFNMNNTPFNATAPADNLDPDAFDPTMGYERWNTNRSIRFGELISQYDKLSYADFKRIKYDLQLPKRLSYAQGPDANALFELDPDAYPDIRDLIYTIRTWNRQATVNSQGAAAFLVFYRYWQDKLSKQTTEKTVLTADDCAAGLRHVQAYLRKHFGRTDITLGDYQKHVRGKTELPIWGIPDVLASIYAIPYRQGQVRSSQGESYISLVRFPRTGLPLIETVNCFGASGRPDSPHYTDQMALFAAQKTKPMTLDKQEVLRTAKRIYHPGQ